MMKKFIVILLAISIFCSPVVNSAYAGQIQAQMISQIESVEMETMEANSSYFIESVQGGGDDALAMLGALFLVAAVLAALAK